MMLTLYGLKSCDTCRKARQEIEKSGKSLEYIDVRATPLEEAELLRFQSAFGDSLLNKRSTTWRQLDADTRLKPLIELLIEHPTLMKRPVIKGLTLTLGWDAAARQAHLG